MNLTPKQKKLADEYIKTGNAMQSAITAGYSKARSSEMLENVGIKSYIAERAILSVLAGLLIERLFVCKF